MKSNREKYIDMVWSLWNQIAYCEDEAKKAELNELSCMYLKKIFEDCLDDLEIPEFMES